MTVSPPTFLILEGHPRFPAGTYATEKQIISAFHVHRDSIRYVANPSNKICLASIGCSAISIQYIKDPSEELMMEAVRLWNFDAILAYIKKPTYKVCLCAVKKNSKNLEFSPFQTEEIQLEAIRKNAWIILDIEHKTPVLITEALKSKGILIAHLPQTEENCLLAVQSKDALDYVRNQTPEICRVALKMNPVNAMPSIENLTLELCQYAYSIEPETLYYIPYALRAKLVA